MIFSIGLPIIKSAFLVKTLESIKEQTFSDYQVIVQNNASSEQDKATIREMVAPYLADKRFQYFENAVQLGMAENFNDVLSKAQGDYFTILSDDDVIDADFLTWIYEVILKYKQCNVFHCRLKIIDADENLIDISPICPEFETQSDFIYQRLSPNRRVQYLSDFVVNTARFKEMGGFDTTFKTGWGLDDLAWFKIAADGVGYTANIGLYYRSHGGNLTASKKFQARFDDIDHMISETSKIVSDPYFIKTSVYPLSYFEKKIKHVKSSRYLAIFTQSISRLNIFAILVFYFRNKRYYKFRPSYLYHAVRSKLKKE